MTTTTTKLTVQKRQQPPPPRPPPSRRRGNALHWRYVLRLPVGGREWAVDFDDWMFLVDEHTMLNSARMSKYGFGLGEVSLFFRKQA